MAITAIFRGLQLASSTLDSVLSKRGTRLQKKMEAVRTMERAINNTRAYLAKNHGRYHPSTELSNLWNDAFVAMLPIEPSLAKSLNASSRFWSDPTVWKLEAGAMELVPGLDELSESCDVIIEELMRRMSK